METSNQILQDDITHNETTYSMVYIYNSTLYEFGIYLNPNDPSEMVILRSVNTQKKNEGEDQYFFATVEDAMDRVAYLVMREVCSIIKQDRLCIEDYIEMMEVFNAETKALKKKVNEISN